VVDVAIIQFGPGIVELIVPVGGDREGPQHRLLAQRSGPSHFASWCSDVPTVAARLTTEGAEILLVSLGPDVDTSVVPADARELLPAAAVYLQLKGGPIIELNPEANESTFTGAWGEGERLLELVRPAATTG
jgi:hypothetical protein